MIVLHRLEKTLMISYRLKKLFLARNELVDDFCSQTLSQISILVHNLKNMSRILPKQVRAQFSSLPHLFHMQVKFAQLQIIEYVLSACTIWQLKIMGAAGS